MIFAPLAGAALIISVATGPALEPTGSPVHMSAQQKTAAMESLVRSATDCIADKVASDPRYKATASAELGDLIVESMSSCVGVVRAMISGYDRYFGDGTGEAFFIGPYLDVLPAAVTKRVKDSQ
jgi:hypothetical protein